MEKKYIFLLIHGAAVGGWVFEDLATLLRMYGHETHNPTLMGLGEREESVSPAIDLTTHVEETVDYILKNDLKDIIIVGHSYGGSVIAGVVERIPNLIKHQVYLDTFFLEDDECIMDILGEERKKEIEAIVERDGKGWLIPRECYGKYHPHKVAHPWKCFIEKMNFTERRDGVPGSYIDCMDPTGYEHLIEPKKVSRKRIKKRGWKIYYLDSNHTPMLKSPQRENLLNILLRIGCEEK